MADTRQFPPALLLLSGLLLCFFFVCLCGGDSPHMVLPSPCTGTEREALLQFKLGLHDPANRLSSWVADGDCCDWSGVRCGDNHTGHVVKLNLRNTVLDEDGIPNYLWSLGGEIRPSLLALKHLSWLDLSGNDFAGRPIPEFMGSLGWLTYLNLSLSGLAGTIPHDLGNLSRLQGLDLSFQHLLSIDDARWVSRLSSLRQLSLQTVNLSSASDSVLARLNMLPLISSVSLAACGLSSLPPLPHLNFTHLSVLDLSLNSFCSPIPEWLPNITSLEYLYLLGSNFTGRIPLAIGNMSSLKVFDISGTSWLDGKLPSTFRNLCKLRELSAADLRWGTDIDEFEGILSGCIRKSLQSLDLRYNQLNGNFPDWLGELKSLKHLSLSWNSLQGPIPSFLGRLSSLETLDLSFNKFNGSIPHSLGGLSLLTSMDLGYNQLEGTIPKSLGNLSRLVHLDVSNNRLGGTIPKSLGNLSRLVELYVSNNSLGGTLSTEHFVNLRSLERLSMGGSNKLAFHMSSEWVPPFRLEHINMGSCKLGPLFPTWLRLQQEVYLLNLSYSKISDTMPDWYWSSTSTIDTLDLSHNEIHGRLSNSLRRVTISAVFLQSNRLEGEMPQFLSKDILYLDMSNNTFSGSIPMSLCRIQGLQFLDISRNNLSGDIPKNCWKDSSQSFSVLKLAHNVLLGAIPSSLGALSSLKVLQLNSNKLSGELPLSLRNCSRMMILDLGENKFTGKIPTWVAEHMPSLKVLRLRSNNFSGNIPPNLSSLSELQIIDVADNDLTGIIPPNFGNFSSMKFTHNMSQKRDDVYHYYIWFGGQSYTYSVDVVMKGIQYEYKELLQLVISIDLSNNRLSGSMPRGLADLLGLQTLNISGNMITGEIIQNISALHWLESLDLSRNNLSGVIPPLMSSMTFLEHLNLSFNNFSGMIPTAHQFDTFIDTSIYMGNPYLCGFPLKPCEVGDEPREMDHKGESDVDVDNNTTIWLYLSLVLGFIFGFWVVCGTLIVKQRWRNVFFKLIDDIYDQLHVFIIVHVRRLKRIVRKKIERQCGSLAC